MSLMKKGATITVYHKHEANKTLKIQVEESVAVGNPSLVGDADGIWSVPCDLTGFDASLNKSKKNKKKPIKIRFHADAFQKANKDLAFAKQMNAAGVKLLADLLGTAWSLEPPAKADPRLTHIKNLRQLLSETPIVTQSSTTVALTWLLKDKSLACDTIRSSVQCATNTDAKTAELRFIGRDDLNELLLLADVDEALVGSDCEVRADCLRWLLQKKVDKRTEEAQPKTRNLKPFRAWDTVRLGPSKDRLRTVSALLFASLAYYFSFPELYAL
uniref:Uncharacterized protein n=1 Tax=Plectus sambesii TaxID=2011161 RepID=A0A914VKM8_9BILA